MSSSKKIRSRLDRLFTDIKDTGQEETASGDAREARVTAPHFAPAITHQTLPSNDALSPSALEFRPNIAVDELDPGSLSAFMSVPFQTGNEWNLLQLDNGVRQVWQEEDQNLVKQIADQLGLALQNAQLLGETQKTAQRLEAVAEIASNVSSILELQPLLETTVHLAQQRFGLYHAHIFMFDKTERSLSIQACGWENGTTHEGLHEKRSIDIGASISIVARAAREKKPIVDNDVHNDANWLPNPMLPDVQSEIAIPIINANRVLGVLNAHSNQLNFFTEADLSIMTTLATQIGSAIQNARLFEETQRRSKELAILNNIVRSVSEQIGLKQVLEADYKEIQKLVSVDTFFVALFEAKTGMVEFPFLVDDGQVYSEPAIALNPESYTGKTILHGKTIQDFRNAEELAIEETNAYRVGDTARLSGSLLFVPLKLGQNTIGCLSLQSYAIAAYTLEDVSLIESISNQLTATILNARLFNQMQTNEENFRNLVENAPEAIIVIDATTGYFSEPNSNACNLLGYSAEELTGIRPIDLSPEFQPDQRSSVEALTEKINAALNGTAPAFEWLIKNALGQLIPCEIHLSRLPGERPRARATIIDITERKKAEEEVSKFKMGIERSADAVFMTDINGKIIYINPAFSSVYGFSPQEALGNTPRLFKSGLLSQADYKEFWDSLLSKKTISREITNRTKDGRNITVIGTNSPILDSTGNIQGFLSVHHDLTSAKKAEDALRSSEAELRALFAAMKDVVLILDKDGRYIKIAQTNPDGRVKPSEDLIGKTIFEIFPHTDADRIINIIQTVLRTNDPVQFDYSVEIDTQQSWFQGVISPMHDNAVVWVVRDITEAKKAEQTLQDNDEKLRRQNEYLATAAEVSRLVTSTLDLDTLFNRTVDLIRSRFAYYFVSIFTLDEANVNAVMREGTGDVGEEMKARAHSLPVGSRSIIGNVTSSGKTIVVNNTINDPIHRPNPLLPETRAETGIPLKIGSRTIGAIDIQSKEAGAFHPEDIAVLETLADQIAIALDNANSYLVAQRAVAELREVDRIKSQFLANMSHELRTPLNSIIGFSRVILKGIDGPISEQQQQDLNAIYNSGQHLLGLINDILDLSKIEAGKMELSLEELNIIDTINSVMSTAAGFMKDKPVKLINQVSADMPTVRADPMRIRQVLLNLISNASKFTDEGSVTITAAIQTGTDHRQEMIVSVIDTGAGISDEDQEKLFLAFSQVDASPTRKTGGTGLGLSISQHMINLHSGKIGVHSTVGKGSTFYFTIPLFNQPGLGTEDGKERVILCIDDDPQILSLYDRYLKPQGYKVISAINPANACVMAKRNKPYAIMLDIMMPEVDGWTLLEQLKSDPDTRGIPVIVCSIVEEEEKGFSLGAADYLVKPIMEEDLVIALNRLNSDGKIKNVLIIDDSIDDLRLMEKILLEHSNFHPILAEGGKKGWDILVNQTPHAVILDLFMPDINGFTILERLRTTPNLQDLPVVVVSGMDLDANQKKQLDDLGKHMLVKGMLGEKELFSALEKALKRFETTK
jgi:PAS domain S-box-containing protein